ncbi:MAG: BamA/TamA family outer membrane protein [Bacteroidales bacterium]
MKLQHPAFTYIIVIISSLTVCPFPSFAQEKSDKELSKEDKKEQRAAKKQKKLDSGKIMISPVAGPGYTPEMGLLIGGGALVSWRTDKSDLELQRSNMPVMLSYSTKGALSLNLRPSTFWMGDKLRINGNFWFKDMSDNYWGVGYETNNETEQSKDITEFNRKWVQFKIEGLRRVAAKLYAGLNFDLNYTKGSEETSWILSSPYYTFYNERPFNMGLGAIFRYDSRDLAANAWSGMYINGEMTQYGKYFGGDNTYTLLLLDYRQYTRINNKDGRILAWQVSTRNTFGDVPYAELSQLGNPFDLRGYPWGKYRNKGMAYAVLEYRHDFKKKTGGFSRHGAVLWLGSGMIYDTDNDPLIDHSGKNKVLPNAGIGYRFELQPRMNLRLDFGVGRNGVNGFYFNINEAF